MNEQQVNTVKQEPGSPQTHILIVEDSMIQAELLRRMLVQQGYRVTLAKDGAEGLAAARKEPPKVIVSDITMPVMDGYEMCRAIRQDAELKDIPVILLTMQSDTQDVVRGLNAGADYYVTKPYNEQYLISRIYMALLEPHNHSQEKDIEVTIAGEKHQIRAGRQQILNLLISTYENAALKNRELLSAQDQLKILNERLEEKSRELVEANKDLEGFAYSVSHDLRTPLRAIDGFSHQVLKRYEDKLDDEGKRYLNLVRDNTQKMSQLIDDILAFSRMGRLGMSMAEINMEGLAREVFEELLRTANGRDLTVEIKPLPPAHGDHAILRQVWVNLLGNAIKFTRRNPAAAIQIGSYAEGKEIVYFVKDNGAGFDMQYAGKLFGVFQRLHSVEEFEGTGIGLAIVKRIITRHGGRVWAEGKVNKGATIYFALPV
jgi:signal transduction histidine kinase